MAKLLYGSSTDMENCAGFCYHHHKWLTVRQIKRRKCLSRGGHEYCYAFKARQEHPWWELRRLKKEQKERNKGKK